jgi:hypothetical protein
MCWRLAQQILFIGKISDRNYRWSGVERLGRGLAFMTLLYYCLGLLV